MEKEITDERILALIEGAEDNELEDQIQKDLKLQKRYNQLKELLALMEDSLDHKVPDRIGLNLQEAIADEMNSSTTQTPWLQVAAAVTLLVLGFFMGSWSNASGNGEELAELRQEITSLREMTLTSTLQQPSASERILAVNQIEEKNTIGSELLQALATTLNSDESPNVRYAALQALKKFIEDEQVKAELVKSLESQTDPLIQISLISILLEAEEKSAIAPLKNLIDQNAVMPEVKRQAEIALKVLT